MPNARRFANAWQRFKFQFLNISPRFRLVLGCIETNFCKQMFRSSFCSIFEIYRIYTVLHRSKLLEPKPCERTNVGEILAFFMQNSEDDHQHLPTLCRFLPHFEESARCCCCRAHKDCKTNTTPVVTFKDRCRYSRKRASCCEHEIFINCQHFKTLTQDSSSNSGDFGPVSGAEGTWPVAAAGAS